MDALTGPNDCPTGGKCRCNHCRKLYRETYRQVNKRSGARQPKYIIGPLRVLRHFAMKLPSSSAAENDFNGNNLWKPCIDPADEVKTKGFQSVASGSEQGVADKLSGRTTCPRSATSGSSDFPALRAFGPLPPSGSHNQLSPVSLPHRSDLLNSFEQTAQQDIFLLERH